MQVETNLAGLTFSGSYSYEPATGPTYACGGTPEYHDTDIQGVTVEDPDGDWGAALADDLSFGVSQAATTLARLGIALPESVSKWLMDHYEVAAIEASWDEV